MNFVLWLATTKKEKKKKTAWPMRSSFGSKHSLLSHPSCPRTALKTVHIYRMMYHTGYLKTHLSKFECSYSSRGFYYQSNIIDLRREYSWSTPHVNPRTSQGAFVEQRKSYNVWPTTIRKMKSHLCFLVILYSAAHLESQSVNTDPYAVTKSFEGLEDMYLKLRKPGEYCTQS